MAQQDASAEPRPEEDARPGLEHDAGPGPEHDVRPGPVTGGCLCGAVRYEVRGPLRDVLICHCEECRRWCGHYSASSAADKGDLVISEARGLRWIDSPRSEACARRGFCGECGSSLFWDPPDRQTISIAAGTLDDGAGLRVLSHWYVTQAGGYYQVPDDGLPHHAGSGEGELP